MFIFWWHGRGYLTLLIWLLVMIGCGVLLTVGRQMIPDRPWVWGVAFLVAAAINWRKGSVLNARSLRKAQTKTVWKRLFYKAAHRFMSMPMETFSLVLALAGVGIAINGFVW